MGKAQDKKVSDTVEVQYIFSLYDSYFLILISIDQESCCD